MMPQRRDWVAAMRFAGRRRREDDAPRLSELVPAVAALRIEVEERDGPAFTKHVRHLVIHRAPALFVLPCGDPHCSGEHDMTSAVMCALRARETTFSGGGACLGSVGSLPCIRVVRFRGTAEYRPTYPRGAESGRVTGGRDGPRARPMRGV
jgi:hypothetical protein